MQICRGIEEDVSREQGEEKEWLFEEKGQRKWDCMGSETIRGSYLHGQFYT